MDRNQLIANVALRMDEITPTSAINIAVDGSDNNPLYALIDGLVDSGVLELFSVAPFWRLHQTKFEPANISFKEENDRRVVRIKLNDDFLRVAEINVEGFQRPITEVVPEQSAEGKRQHNRWLRGKVAKPVGVVSFGLWDNETCREIDCFSLPPKVNPSDPDPDVIATYIAKPENIGDLPSTVEDVVPPVLIPALEWLIAARAFGARGDANHAAICQQNAQNLLV